MNDEQIAELEATTAVAKTAAEAAGGKDEALNKALKESEDALAKAKEPSHDPIVNELSRVKKPKTEKEKAEYVFRSTANRLKELGSDPAAILGTAAPTADDDDDAEVPEWYKKEKAKDSEKTAMQLADEITDPHERELVKHQLTSVATSGTPQERIKVARGYVNSLRNAQIAEEAARRGNAKNHSSGSGAPARNEGEAFTPTQAEASMMANFGLTEQEVLAARAKEAEGK